MSSSSKKRRKSLLGKISRVFKRSVDDDASSLGEQAESRGRKETLDERTDGPANVLASSPGNADGDAAPRATADERNGCPSEGGARDDEHRGRDVAEDERGDRKLRGDRYMSTKIAFLERGNDDPGEPVVTRAPRPSAVDVERPPRRRDRGPKGPDTESATSQLRANDNNTAGAPASFARASPVAKETKVVPQMNCEEDSDFSADSTEESFQESSEDEADRPYESGGILEYFKEEYFTKGKYMTYFFLELERQFSDPSDVYKMVLYRGTDCEKQRSERLRKEGENSSSGSLSPNISGQLRRRLLYRRSADNLMVNSPTNSMRHSSPESIRSAPIQNKLRSTSHDALSKRKDRYFAQTTGASMDSLAKQSLLAAQVLNLIPTQKARERNFLHGRIAANSLLGPVELEKVLPNRELKIFIGTWNMNGQSPPKELNDFMLPSDIETVPDLLAIGTQESCSERNEWEAALQETLGPSHVLLTSSSLGTLHLALFLRRDLIWFCSIPEEDSFSTRTGTAFRTKGAVAIALMIFGTSFLFVTAHLTAHQDKVKERVNDIKRIVRNLDLPRELPTRHKSKDVTQNFDCVFWCGDLNFRLAQPREEVIQWITNTCFPQESINLHKDQLKTSLNEGSVLRGFEEAPITFPPTYKYDPGTQNFDSSNKQRTPAYTDRILYKGKGHTRGYIRRLSHDSGNSHKDGAIECLIYDSVPSICTSDHKPVWGVFKTTLRPGIDTIPLGAGLFNREIYLEGIRRRAAAMDDSLGTSKVCSIQ